MSRRWGQENYEDMVAAISNPLTVRSMVEDYRASLHVDREADAHDRQLGHRIQCPTLVCWSTDDDMEDLYGNPGDVWTPWCVSRPKTAAIDSGHHMAEDNPEQVTSVLQQFLVPD